ncbi:MAG: aldo/keto reductase [Rhodobacteraceae bacterium]|nr:aldo/keto reductase [Paracoccaceae bacterium]
MRYNRLGQSGLVVSRMCFGAGSLGVGETLPGLIKNIDANAATEIVAKAIDAGINFFDTSDKYVDGHSEETLGKALGTKRKDVIVATKCGLPVGPTPNDRGLSAHHIIRSCERSLRRLGTDWVDIYYAHTFDNQTPLEETARAFEYLIQRGMARYVAVSNWPAWMAARMLGIQDKMGYAPAACNQVYYSLVGRDIERELVPMSAATGLGIIVYSALAGGFLSGKYERDKPPPAGTRRATFTMAPKLEMDTAFKVVDTLKELAPKYGVKPGQVALAWTMARPFISSVIFGISRASQLEENLMAADLVLSDEDDKRLDALTAIA